MGELKQSFVKLVRQVTAPQMPQFMIWLDVKLAEYKLNGYMRLGIFVFILLFVHPCIRCHSIKYV